MVVLSSVLFGLYLFLTILVGWFSRKDFSIILILVPIQFILVVALNLTVGTKTNSIKGYDIFSNKNDTEYKIYYGSGEYVINTYEEVSRIRSGKYDVIMVSDLNLFGSSINREIKIK